MVVGGRPVLLALTILSAIIIPRPRALQATFTAPLAHSFRSWVLVETALVPEVSKSLPIEREIQLGALNGTYSQVSLNTLLASLCIIDPPSFGWLV